MSQTSKIIDKVEANVIHTYNRYQVALEKGEERGHTECIFMMPKERNILILAPV